MKCSHCGSENLGYAEDTTTTYAILEMDDARIRVEPEGAEGNEAFNARLVCVECNEEMDIPDGVRVEIAT